MDSWLSSPKDTTMVIAIILILILIVLLIIAAVYAWNNSGNNGGSQSGQNHPDENSVTSRYGPPLQEDSCAQTPAVARSDISGESSSSSSSSDSDKIDPLRVESDLSETPKPDSHTKSESDRQRTVKVIKRRHRK